MRQRRKRTYIAVYEFLKRNAHCCFAAYSSPDANAGEIIPHAEALKSADGEYIRNGADLPYRSAIVQFGESAGNAHLSLNVRFFDRLVKNRYNRIHTWSSVYETFKSDGLLPEIERRGLSLTVGHHEASGTFLPCFGNEYFPEKYLETHPEYFRLEENGKRYSPDGTHGTVDFLQQKQRMHRAPERKYRAPGYAIAFPITNTDTRGFVGDKWYDFED